MGEAFYEKIQDSIFPGNLPAFREIENREDDNLEGHFILFMTFVSNNPFLRSRSQS
jgi:hypothetical protein